MFKNHFSFRFLLIYLAMFCFPACSPLLDIPTDYGLDLSIDTDSAVKAGADWETLEAISEINNTFAQGIQVGPETRQLIEDALTDLNRTLREGARVGLDQNSLNTVNHLINTIGQGLDLDIQLNTNLGIDADTRDWMNQVLSQYVPDLAEDMREQIVFGTTEISEEVKTDIIEILEETQQNFTEMARNVGLETRCNADFAQGRMAGAIDETIDTFVATIVASRINSVLMLDDPSQQAALLVKAAICSVEPAPLELVSNGNTLIPKEPILNVIGYDFLEENLPDIEIRTNSGDTYALLKASRVSNYQMQVNLQTVDFSNVGVGAEVAFIWPYDEQNAIIVLQPTPTSVPPTITPIPTIEPCTSVTIDSPDGVLNVRTGPGTVFNKIAQLPNGATPCVTGQALNVAGDLNPSTNQVIVWWRIDLDGQAGWISSLYTFGDCSNCPTITPPATPTPKPAPLPTSTPLPQPVADFQCGPTTGLAPLTVDCIDLSTNNPQQWLWEFGDGTISNARNPQHTFGENGQSGSYTIRLTVTNPQGSSTKELNITVNSQPPPTPVAPEPIRWTYVGTENVGEPSGLEAQTHPIPTNYVITGIGGRVDNDNFTTLVIQIAPILDNGLLGQREVRNFGSEPNHELEAAVVAPDSQEVVVGLGMRVNDNNLTTLVIYTRRLDPTTGTLGNQVNTYSGGTQPTYSLELDYLERVRPWVLVGIGVRVNEDNVTTFNLDYGQIGN